MNGWRGQLIKNRIGKKRERAVMEEGRRKKREEGMHK